MTRQKKKPAEVTDLHKWRTKAAEAQPATAPAAIEASAEDGRRQRHEEDARVLRQRQEEEEMRAMRERRQRTRGDEDLRTLVERARRQRRGENMRTVCSCAKCLSLAASPACRTRGRP